MRSTARCRGATLWADAAIHLRLDADQYVACMIGGQGFIHIHAHTGADRGTHVRGGDVLVSIEAQVNGGIGPQRSASTLIIKT